MMPARGTRRNASKAVPESPSQSAKRHTEEKPGQDSPIRRSKRVKTDGLTPPQSRSQKNGNDRTPRSAALSQVIDPSSLKPEAEEETNISVGVKREKKDGTDESTAIVTGKTSRKRKTKEEKEAEAMPLRARTQGLRMFVGAHVSAAKGVFNSVINSSHIGGNAFALFLKSQRKWDNPALQDDHRDQFRQACLEHKYDGQKHILPHGSYLVNLAQEDKAKAKQAYNSFLDDLQRCEALGINLYNFHPGAANKTSLADAIARLSKVLTDALAATSTVTPVLETMCGQGTTIGGTLTEFRDILALIPKEYHSRIGICVDTCHSHAAGYDLVSAQGFQDFLKEFENIIGLKHLRALHLNDSKTPRGSHRDLHANIGTGFLGLRAFHNVMNEPRLEGLPMILETPIDRPVSAAGTGKIADNPAGEECCASEEESASGSEGKPNKSGKTKKPRRSAASAKTPTVADPFVWAQEIELLESLIGMDPEGEQFKTFEKQLADEGSEMRAKHLEQFERKRETEEKKKNKAAETAAKKGQMSLTDMMKGSTGKRATKSRRKSSDDSGDEG